MSTGSKNLSGSGFATIGLARHIFSPTQPCPSEGRETGGGKVLFVPCGWSLFACGGLGAFLSLWMCVRSLWVFFSLPAEAELRFQCRCSAFPPWGVLFPGCVCFDPGSGWSFRAPTNTHTAKRLVLAFAHGFLARRGASFLLSCRVPRTAA